LEGGNPSFPACASSSPACTRRAKFLGRHRPRLQRASQALEKRRIRASLGMQVAAGGMHRGSQALGLLQATRRGGAAPRGPGWAKKRELNAP
jgi:hypothetical protein